MTCIHCTALKLYAWRMAPLGKVRPPVYSAQIMHRGKIMTHYEIQHPLGFHTIYKLGNEPINKAIVAQIRRLYEQNLCVCKKLSKLWNMATPPVLTQLQNGWGPRLSATTIIPTANRKRKSGFKCLYITNAKLMAHTLGIFSIFILVQ